MRTVLVLATALVAGVVPVSLGAGAAFAAPAPAAPAPAVATGTVVQEGGRLTVPAGEEGPVTLRLKATLPDGVTGPVRARLALPVKQFPPAGPNPHRLAAALVSTCAVDGGAFAPCVWDAPWLDGEDYPYPVRIDLPVTEAATTLGYALTIDTSLDQAWVGSLDAPVELTDSTGTVVARGTAGLDFVAGTPAPKFLGTVHARDKAGVLWRYEGTGRADKPLKPRKRIGGGWNVYTSVVPLFNPRADGTGDLVARDGSGVLWLYKGTGDPNAPFAPRTKVGAGWNAYTAMAGRSNGSLVARDEDGVLWNYERTVNRSSPFYPRSRVGAGWNVYDTLVGYGRGPVARDSHGVLWKYDETAGTDPEGYPFRGRMRVGGGWNIYTAVVGTVDLGPRDYYGDAVARDRSGALWFYQGVYRGGTTVPGPTRTLVGGGWNSYDLLF
ncbi:tachylectin-related carbohydrate-binding protein [Streptomyces cinereoruber]|uniref:hypothetical protein n=1 Tax=Streptomyces cinereoruber TaxID=67260 RepID=UPI003EB8E190